MKKDNDPKPEEEVKERLPDDNVNFTDEGGDGGTGPQPPTPPPPPPKPGA